MNIAVLTSGGDSPGMNAAIRAVVRTALNLGHMVYGVKNGYKGLVENQMDALLHRDVSEVLQKGGTFLGTSRCDEFQQLEYRKIAANNLKNRNIEALVAIGGNGTAMGALKLHELGVKVIAIPGSIDNDVNGTDYTIGYHTALNTIVEAVDKLRDTSMSHKRCSIVETMGRYCSDLAISSGICTGAEIVLSKDYMLDNEKIYELLNMYYSQGKNHAIILVTEHTLDVHALAKGITANSSFDARATILGHIQRGGCPVPQDRILATRLGCYAVELLNKGKSGLIVGIKNNKITYTKIEDIEKEEKNNKELYEILKLAS